MTRATRPESLEGRWDILYRDYPEVYEEFGRIPKVPAWRESGGRRGIRYRHLVTQDGQACQARHRRRDGGVHALDSAVERKGGRLAQRPL